MTYQIISDATADLNDELLARFPDAEIYIAPFCPVIGTHAGPGVMTVFFCGNNH